MGCAVKRLSSWQAAASVADFYFSLIYHPGSQSIIPCTTGANFHPDAGCKGRGRDPGAARAASQSVCGGAGFLAWMPLSDPAAVPWRHVSQSRQNRHEFSAFSSHVARALVAVRDGDVMEELVRCGHLEHSLRARLSAAWSAPQCLPPMQNATQGQGPRRWTS